MKDSKELTEAKISLGINPAVLFYSNLLANLKCEETTDTATADVDGVNLRINPEWFGKLTVKQRVGLLAHEASHVIYEHGTLLQVFPNAKKANYAADYYINNELRSSGVELPPNGLWSDDYIGMSVGEIYDLLEDIPDEDYDDGLLDVKAYNPDSEPLKHFDVVNAVKIAIETTKSQGGYVPSEAQKLVDDALHPPIDWYNLLMKHAASYAETEVNWDDPNFDYLPDFILPNLGGLKVNDIAFAVDSSGSVMDHEYATFLSAIQNCRDIIPAEKTTVLDFTTHIVNTYELDESQDTSILQFRSSGGTDIQCVFDYYKDRESPKFLVIFSDLECYPITEVPPYPVIWICCNNPHAVVHFGELIHYSTY